MKKIILFLIVCLFLFSCSKTDDPVVFNYNFLIGTWTEYKSMQVYYIDTNKPYKWDSGIYIDTIAFSPLYQEFSYYKYKGNWYTNSEILNISPLGNNFTEVEYHSVITQDDKNIIIEYQETDYNRKFYHYFKKISKEWKLEYMLNDISKNK